MNLLRFARRLLISRLTGKRIPFQLNIHLTDRCNLRCRYCYIDFKRAHKDMEFKDVKRILAEAREAGVERVSLEGGEPLLRDDIGSIVNLVNELGMECNINTNGILLPRRIEEIRKADMISLSLDGSKDVNDRNRGKGSFNAAIRAIETAKAHGLKVQVLSVLTKDNRDSVDFILETAKKMGFSFVPTSLFFTPGTDFDKDKAGRFVLGDEDYRGLLQKLSKKKSEGYPVVWSFQTLNYVRNWPTNFLTNNLFDNEGHKRENFVPIKCHGGRSFCVIETNGDLFPCDPLLGYGQRINCLKLGFKEAFGRLTKNNCRACNSLVCTELNQLFSLNPAVIMNLIKNYGRLK